MDACAEGKGSVMRGAVPPLDFLAVILMNGIVVRMVGVCGRELWAELWTLIIFLWHEARQTRINMWYSTPRWRYCGPTSVRSYGVTGV
jgi:hypothetical protein